MCSEADLGRSEEHVNFIALSVQRSILMYLYALQPTKPHDKQRYISLGEAIKYCPYSQEYLSLLARRGDVWNCLGENGQKR